MIASTSLSGPSAVASEPSRRSARRPGVQRLTCAAELPFDRGVELVLIRRVATFTKSDSGIGFASAWSPTGGEVAVAGFDDCVRGWNVATGQPTLTAHHAGTVPCVSWSPDGRTVASGTSAGSVQLFAAGSGQSIARAAGHTDEVRSLAHSPSGAYLASAANDGTVRVWWAADLAPVATITAHAGLVRSVSWSPDSASLASGGHDNTLRVWNADGWTANGGLADHRSWIAAVAYSPDGRHLASASGDGTVRVWNLAAARYAHVFDDFDGWGVSDLAYSPDGRHLATIDMNPTMRVFEMVTGTVVATANASYGSTALSWSPDGRFLCSTGFEADIWSVTG